MNYIALADEGPKEVAEKEEAEAPLLSKNATPPRCHICICV